MMLLLATTIFAQQLSTRETEDGKTARLVSDMILDQHVKRAPLDDDVSSKLLDTFLKQLDPQKLYFTQADVDSFDAGELRASTGVALMWRSPMGPISISYAYPLRKEDDDELERLQFTFGGTF